MRSTILIHALKDEIKVLQDTFSFYLNRLETEVHALRVTVTFFTENSFDLSLISANSAAD